jgi:hypothetical protein
MMIRFAALTLAMILFLAANPAHALLFGFEGDGLVELDELNLVVNDSATSFSGIVNYDPGTSTGIVSFNIGGSLLQFSGIMLNVTGDSLSVSSIITPNATEGELMLDISVSGSPFIPGMVPDDLPSSLFTGGSFSVFYDGALSSTLFNGAVSAAGNDVAVPLPATMWLLLPVLGVLARLRRG